MLDAACIYAQNVILDRTVFQLNDEKFNRFIGILEQPHSTNAGLEKLMNIKSPWE